MHNETETAAARPPGWLSALIQRARARGMNNGDIAAALEGSIVLRPLTIGRDGCDGGWDGCCLLLDAGAVASTPSAYTSTSLSRIC